MKTHDYKFFRRANMLVITMLAVLFLGYTSFGQSPPLTILSPNGGESYTWGSVIQVSWQHTGEPADMVIEYTDDGGNYWYYLQFIYSTETSDSILIQFTGNPTEFAKVRISYFNDPTILDESDDFFSVVEAPVYVSSPSFGSVYYQDQPVYIAWYSNSLLTFDLDYSPDNGATWTEIVSNFTGFNYTWTAPSQITSQGVIRISDAADPTAFGDSPTFSILDGPVAVLTSPNGGEVWTYGGTAMVTWSGTNLPPYVNIEFSFDGGYSWSSLGYGYSNPDGGSADVYVPYFETQNALVRLVDYTYYFELDRSDAPFTVEVPPVIIYYPAGGESYYNGETMYFNWITSNEVNAVNFELSTDNGQSWSLIETDVPAAQYYYYWTVSGTPSETSLIRISDANDPSKFAISGMFTIRQIPVITLTSPAGGEIWDTGKPYEISWEYSNPGSTYVYIEYSSDNGQNWNYIGYMPLEGPTGSTEWITPDITSEQCLIRIQDYYLYFVADTSEQFTIIDYPETPICMVTVDSATNRNVIMWEKPVSDLIDQFVVYKESNQANIYEVLSVVDYEGIAMVTDTNSNPNVKSYRYKLGFRNVDGIDFPAGNHHQTIHLTINQGVGSSWNLIWSDYEGFEVSSYNIYRKFAGGEFEQISSISASFSSYTDVSVQSGDVYYIIEVVNPNGCNPNRTGEYGSSWSNVATNSFTGVEDNKMEMNLSTYPNPAGEKLNLSIGQDIQGSVKIALSDLLGRTVRSQEVMDLKWNSIHTIDVSDLKEGIYMLKVSSDEGSTTRKVIVRH